MKVVGQEEMEALFAITDELPLSRESVVVPLLREGVGSVRRLADGRFEITLPDGDLGPFLERLPGLLPGSGPQGPQ